MLWFFLSLSAAISSATKNLFSKRSLRRVDEYVVAWSLRAFALPFLLPFLFFFKVSSIDSMFWHALLASGSLNVLASILFMKALKVSPLSLSIPMITFTPLFLLLTSPIIVGEFPSVVGAVGILLIVFGAYLLNLHEVQEGFIQPFKALLRERGPVWMLCVAFIWSITANLDKIAIQHSSPFFYGFMINLFLFIAFIPIVLVRSRKSLGKVSSNVRILFLVGLFSALTLIFQFYAIDLSIVPYVISIKRMGAIFSTLYGFLFLGEKRMKERLLAVLTMLFGALLITLS